MNLSPRLRVKVDRLMDALTNPGAECYAVPGCAGVTVATPGRMGATQHPTIAFTAALLCDLLEPVFDAAAVSVWKAKR